MRQLVSDLILSAVAVEQQAHAQINEGRFTEQSYLMTECFDFVNQLVCIKMPVSTGN